MILLLQGDGVQSDRGSWDENPSCLPGQVVPYTLVPCPSLSSAHICVPSSPLTAVIPLLLPAELEAGPSLLSKFFLRNHVIVSTSQPLFPESVPRSLVGLVWRGVYQRYVQSLGRAQKMYSSGSTAHPRASEVTCPQSSGLGKLTYMMLLKCKNLGEVNWA